MAKVITAPESREEAFQRRAGNVSLFLAGSIENGAAEPWQDKVIESLKDIDGLFIMNPRRKEWDPAWNQSSDNKKLTEQITWELTGLRQAGAVLFYFQPGTVSPVTLLELGLVLSSKPAERIFVACPDGYFRKANVEVTCAYVDDIYVDSTLEQAVDRFVRRLPLLRN